MFVSSRLVLFVLLFFCFVLFVCCLLRELSKKKKKKKEKRKTSDDVEREEETNHWLKCFPRFVFCLFLYFCSHSKKSCLSLTTNKERKEMKEIYWRPID